MRNLCAIEGHIKEIDLRIKLTDPLVCEDFVGAFIHMMDNHVTVCLFSRLPGLMWTESYAASLD